MLETPLVSVIIPTYNSGGFVGATLESALRQTLADFEIIVVDDGSSDDTVARVRSFPDRRLRVFEQAHRGAPAALNAAVQAARGRYIAFLDHDDLWLPAKLERHIAFFESNPSTEATFSWSGLIDERGWGIKFHPAHWRGPISFRQLLEDYVVGSSSSVVMRQRAIAAAGGFDEQLPCCHDSDLVLRIALTGENAICAVPEELTLYRRHAGQMSRDWRAMQRDWKLLLEKFRRLAPAETAAAERKAQSNINRYFAYLAYEEADFPSAFHFLGRALRCHASAFLGDWRNWRTAAACFSGAVLPRPMHRRLEKLAGIRNPT
jgi:glycosyltransferase involved in cell wall biosynthesis